MHQTNFKLLLDALTQVAVFYGGYWVAFKTVKEYFQVRVAEADRKSQTGIINFILKEIDDVKKRQQNGDFTEKEMKLLIDRLVDDLKFLMGQLFEHSLPKRNIKHVNEHDNTNP